MQNFRRVYPTAAFTVSSGKLFTYRYYQNPQAKATLVLLTGGIGLSDLFYKHFARFARDFSVLTFDYQLQFGDNGEFADAVAELLRHLKEKVDAGASHLITQLFFDNDSFYDFRYRAARAGVNVPIEAGIMPVTNRKQIERMVTMCGASLPRKFTKMVQRFEDNPDALRDAGIAYAIDQIVDLVTDGVDGIHLYTMNNPYVARKISEAVGGIIKAAPKC